MGFDLGDLNPVKAVKKGFDKIDDYVGTGLQVFGTATGQPWITAIGSAYNAYSGAKQGQKDAKKANQWERQQFDANVDLQKQFAQQGIRWKVADAKAAGIHPLAALGAQTNSFSPVSIGGRSYADSDPINAALTDIGQNIDRARLAKATAVERQAAQADRMLNQEYMRAQIYGQQLSNEGQLIANQKALSDLNNTKGPTMPPALPAGSIELQPSRPTVSVPGKPYQQPGRYTDFVELVTENGKVIRMPSVDAKQAMEDNLLLEVPWSVRNQIIPELNRARNVYVNNLRKLVSRAQRAGQSYQSSRPWLNR